MRTRSWRRFKMDIIVLKRLKRHTNYYRMTDANGNRMHDYTWMDRIGTHDHFMFKTYTTPNSKYYKDKWGHKGKRSSSYSKPHQCRIYDKRMFKKMLESDYGIKHLNVSYGFI